ncbi:MAG: hypothetical protein K2I14_03285, partial [Eubacterium sp.]|nr:hypothetical protein [Eubacterium sp.]
MKKGIALIAAVVIFLCLAFVYENSYMSKNSLFASGSAVLSERDNRRFYGAETFDNIAYEYEDAIRIIKEGFDNQSDSIRIYSCSITNDELSKVINYIINSGYYYVDNGYSYKSDGKNVISFNPNYLMNSDEVKKHNQEIDSVVEAVVNKSLSFNNNIEKLIYIHNYLVEHTEYSDEENQTINNLYGALVLKKTMCVGYAQAFCRIAEKAGIKTYIVSSEKLNHAWNMVNLNGEYYFVDCTWDDPVFDETNLSGDPVSGYGCYKYFMCSEELFVKKEHNASDYLVNGENIMGVVKSTVYDQFFWRDYESLMRYSNGSWYHDYGYSDNPVYYPSDVKFSIDKFTFIDNKSYNEKIVRTIKACWENGNQFYIEFNPTMQNIDGFLYYFKPDGIYRLEENGRFNGKEDLLIFEN